nr:uncharacterized protein LOC129385916 [Dermacentor andersoni]
MSSSVLDVRADERIRIITFFSRTGHIRTEDAIGAPKGTRLLVLVVSLTGVLVASCALLLVVVAQDDNVGCGQPPDWSAHVDPKERVDQCTGEICTASQCVHDQVNNDTCRGVVRAYADRCRCCEACVLHLGKNSDCSNRPSDLHDVRECGPGLFCNQNTCVCMELMMDIP